MSSGGGGEYSGGYNAAYMVESESVHVHDS
jgi:hypothetical protein